MTRYRDVLKYSRILLTLILIPSLVFLSSCAVIYNGSNQLIPVGSSPQGAEVYVDGELVGTTPLELELARASSHTILLRLDDLEREIIITNILNGGMVALDIAPGATFLTVLLWPAPSPEPCTGLGCGIELDLSGLVTAVVIGGILVSATPIVVDAATGAWYELSPGEVFVDFEQPLETE